MEYEDKLVTTDWLAQNLDDPDLRLLDTSWHMYDTGRDPRAEFEAAHIPGARYFDIDAISDKVSEYPHMLPPPEEFAAAVRALAISNNDQIVVYDNSDLRSAARAWWMFRVFGHDRVAVLDGGQGKWQAENRPLSDRAEPVTHGHFLARYRRNLVASADDVRQALDEVDCLILDARGQGRFAGTEAEPRPGLRSGHIPGSTNLPYGKLFTDDGTLRSEDELKALLETSGAMETSQIITSCGSGVTAAVLAHALFLCGNQAARVFDGSWVEWGSRDDLPIEEGV